MHIHTLFTSTQSTSNCHFLFRIPSHPIPSQLFCAPVRLKSTLANTGNITGINSILSSGLLRTQVDRASFTRSSSTLPSLSPVNTSPVNTSPACLPSSKRHERRTQSLLLLLRLRLLMHLRMCLSHQLFQCPFQCLCLHLDLRMGLRLLKFLCLHPVSRMVLRLLLCLCLYLVWRMGLHLLQCLCLHLVLCMSLRLRQHLRQCQFKRLFQRLPSKFSHQIRQKNPRLPLSYPVFFLISPTTLGSDDSIG